MATISKSNRYQPSIGMKTSFALPSDSVVIRGRDGSMRTISMSDLKVSLGIATEYGLADYATFNSDDFLNTLVNVYGGKFSYKISASTYDGIDLGASDETIFTAIDQRYVPVQVAPYDTIPAHTDASPGIGIQYDATWENWLRSTAIGGCLSFLPSPFRMYNGYQGEAGYPVELYAGGFYTGTMTTTPIDYDSGGGVILTWNPNIYGKGFQIVWPSAVTFSFTVEYVLYDYADTRIETHIVTFTETGMDIDGAFEPYANYTTFTL